MLLLWLRVWIVSADKIILSLIDNMRQLEAAAAAAVVYCISKDKFETLKLLPVSTG